MWEQTFPGTAEQIRHVRAALRPLLSDCPMADDVILVVSELSANAVAHSASGKPGGKFIVRLQHFRGQYVWGEVEDDGSRWDGSLQDSARNASGLYFVLHLVSECGVAYGTERNRVVWFRKRYPAGDQGAVALGGAMHGAGSHPAAPPGRRTQPCTSCGTTAR